MKKKTWNEKSYIGRKPPLNQDQVKIVKNGLKAKGEIRDLLLFCIAIDSSLRGVDLVRLRVGDVYSKERGVKNVIEVQQKSKIISFRLSKYTKKILIDYINNRYLCDNSYLFTSLYDKEGTGEHITPDHYRDLIKKWLKDTGLNPKAFASHSLRRANITHIYNKTGNLKACQTLLGHSNINNTCVYLGVNEEIEKKTDALTVAKKFSM